MAVVQISRIQHRRGNKNDLPRPNLNEGELGFTTNSGQLFIGAPNFPFSQDRQVSFPYKNIEVLTEGSNLTTVIPSEYSFVLPGGDSPTTNPAWITSRTLQSKLDDFVSVKDYGAIGDGKADDSKSIIRALIDILREDLGVINTPGRYRALYFPAGQYKVTMPIPIPPRTVLFGEGVAEPADGDSIAASGIISDFSGTGFIKSGSERTPFAFVTVDGNFLQQPNITDSKTISQNADLQCGTNGKLPTDLYFRNLSFQAINYEQTFGGIQLFRMSRAQRVTFDNCRFKGEYACRGQSNTGQLGTSLDQLKDSQTFHITGWSDFSNIQPKDFYFNNCQFQNFHRAFAPVNTVTNVTITNSVFEEMFLPISLGEDEFFNWNGSPPYIDPCTPGGQPTAWRIQNCRFNRINSHAIAVYTQYDSTSSTGVGHTLLNNKYEQVGNDCLLYYPQIDPQVAAVYFADGTAHNQSIGDVFFYDGEQDQLRIRFNPRDENLIVNPQQIYFPDASTLMPTDTVTLNDNASLGTETGIVIDPSVGNQITINYSISREDGDRKGVIHITSTETGIPCSKGGEFDWTEMYTQNIDIGFDFSVETDNQSNIILTYEDLLPSGVDGTLYFNIEKWLSL